MKIARIFQNSFFLVLVIITITASGQVEERKKSLITKNDGTEYVGIILQEDAREILIQTESIGEIFIPKHEIKSIEELRDQDYRGGKYLGENILATRYFLTTNGLPMKKGDSYAIIQLYGAEYQLAIVDNLTVGGMTSWLGVPIIGTAKYAINIVDNFSASVGLLAGTGSWASWDSYGLLPFGTLTVGNNRLNLNFSAGYLKVGITDASISAPLYSIAGLARLSNKVSFVGDSFIYAKDDAVAIVVPGLRFDRKKGGAFQFGFGGVIFNGEVIPAPIPIVSWFIKV
ncbi:MAG: hypothetical protein WD577_05885 [Bacteroidales bacterium]